ncbi:MAG: ATP-binding protein [Terriglobia bacterium]
MTEKNSGEMTIETIERQREYVKAEKKKGKALGLVFAAAFLRGMRDVGYKSPAWALAEVIDNSFQAAANTVALRFGFDATNKSQAKPDMLAICDDGNGMIPEMIGYAVRWGGTDREGDRTGFGKYGYGLPSSTVSLAKRYTVYSKTPESQWHAVTVDLDALAEAASDADKTERLLSPRAAALPAWLVEAEQKLDLSSLKSGTVIVLEDIDRLRKQPGWITAKILKSKLLEAFGVIYRHWLPPRRIFVEGTEVQAVDPLFLMEHARYYDETPIRATRVSTRTVEVKTDRGTTGRINIRASLLPPNFQLANPAEYPRKGAKNNKRFEIMKAYNGLLICREKRQIDTVQPDWTKFQNYDANVKIEVDFEPELDEYFGITTTKQQITIDDDMWQKLQHSGKDGGALIDLVKDVRRGRDEIEAKLKAEAENVVNEEQQRASAAAMEASEKFKEKVPEPTSEKKSEAAMNLERAASDRAKLGRRPKEETLRELQAETSKRRFEVEFLDIPEGPFYRPIRLGEQKRVVINTQHPFYSKLYGVAPPEVHAALEVLLFVLAERELDCIGDAETFYKAERQKWSERLRHALDKLVADDTIVDKAAAVAEQMHMAAESDVAVN